MEERTKAIEEYLKYFPNDCNAKNNLLLCEYADELGMELTNGYYPKIEYEFFIVNQQIKVGKKYYIANSTTNYKQNGTDSIVIWREPCGRLAFIDNEYWYCVDDEWKEFMDVLKSYNPLDYDEINSNYIFDLEHGKKLIKDYNKIIQDFKDKADKKIKKIQLENKRKELERLQKELEENI